MDRILASYDCDAADEHAGSSARVLEDGSITGTYSDQTMGRAARAAASPSLTGVGDQYVIR